MTQAISKPGYSPVPPLVKSILPVVIVAITIAGIAAVLDRFGYLQHMAVKEYHQYLVKYGLSDQFYIYYFLIFELLIALAFMITGVIIAFRRQATWSSVFAALALMMFGATVPPPLHSLVVTEGTFSVSLHLLRSIGLCLFIIFFYIFPDGRFISSWTRILSIVLVVWSLIWPFYPALDPYRLPGGFSFLVLLFWFSTGVIAQIYRYFHVSNHTEKQQTLWIVFGLTVAFVGDLVTHAPWYVLRSIDTGPDLIISLIHHPFYALSQLVLPICICVSIFRFGLWNIRLIINRTLVLALATALLAGLWEVAKRVLGGIFEKFLGTHMEPLAMGLAVVVATLLFGATFKHLENLANRYLFPSRVNFSKDLSEFLPEALATTHEFGELLQILVERTAEIARITHDAIFLYNPDEELQLEATYNLNSIDAESQRFSKNLIAQMQDGKVITQEENATFSLLVPLVITQGKKFKLIGILAIGPRTDRRGFSTEEISSFKALGIKAGTAIYIAQLNQENKMQFQKQINSLEGRIEAMKKQQGNSDENPL
ncbi:GAF domain-containing protein [Scytonema sp. PCC 10023]|uniref:GAF domain-containing protein n=1 Tax=Scytonema sp. PCC 10023 TaxID=1680591 RepID=UPI0039C6F68E